MSKDSAQATAIDDEVRSVISPGAALRAAREQRGESVNEAAFAIKLSPRQVVALETDDFEALPGTALVRGFMRNYARYLELDPAPLVAQLPPLAGEGAVDLSLVRNAEGELPNGSGTRLRTAPMVWLAVLLLVVVLAGWYFDWFSTEPASPAVEFEVPLQSSSLSDQTSQAPDASGALQPGLTRSSPMPSTAAADQSEAEQVDTEEELVAAEEARVAAATESAAADQGATLAQAEEQAASSVTEEAAASADAGAAAAASDSMEQASAGSAELQFDFDADSWVEVRDRTGGVLHSAINSAGTSRRVGGEPPFALVIGNAASVRLRFNGEPVDVAAGIKGTVARLTVE